MTIVKSISEVRVYGKNNNGNWAVRIRLTDGSELFGGVGGGYNLHQACAMSRNCGERVGEPIRNPIMNNSAFGVPSAPIFQPLPDGIRVTAK